MAAHPRLTEPSSESESYAMHPPRQELAYRAQSHEQLSRIIEDHRDQGWEFIGWVRSRVGLIVRFQRQAVASSRVA